MALSPSRRDPLSPPPRDPRDSTDLSTQVRHHGSYLRQLDPGLQDGRFATLRPVQQIGVDLVGDEGGGGGDSDEILFENGDTTTATAAGSITLNLTYEPIEGSLHIRWNGIDQPPTEWALNEQVVTFTNVHIRVGDVLTAAYAYVDGDDTDDPATLVFHGETSLKGESGNPGLNGLALPVGTEIGDLIVVSHQGDGGIPADLTVNDPRLTAIGHTTHIGFATNLSDIVVTAVGGSGSRWSIACATFGTNAEGWTAPLMFSDNLSPGGLLPVASLAGSSAAVLALSDAHAVVHGTLGAPPGWTLASSSGSGSSHSGVAYWVVTTDPVDSATPAGDALFSGGAGQGYVTVIGLVGP